MLITQDWRLVTLERHTLDKDTGRVITQPPREYVEEISTGDLYSNNEDDTPYELRWKHLEIAAGAAAYGLAMMISNLMKVAIDIVGISIHLFSNFGEIRERKGTLEACAYCLFSLALALPITIAEDLWRVVKAPLYTVGLLFSSLYGVFNPYEGRKWVARIERSWHETNRFADFRYHMDFRPKDEELTECVDMCKESFYGKTLFIALCMQPRGNIKDKIGDQDRYIHPSSE